LDSVHHPSYSHDLAPTDFDLFGVLKDALRGTELQTTWFAQSGHRYGLIAINVSDKTFTLLLVVGARP
jgi:hypothetical protein